MAALCMLSLGLMTLDHHLGGLEKLRSGLSVITTPIRYTVDIPLGWLRWVSSGLIRQEELIKKNNELSAKQLTLQAQIHELTEINRVSEQVKTLLGTHFYANSKFLIAELLAVDVDSSAQQLVVDKGKREGIYNGQPVFDAYGVFGQVINVGPITSLVMLLTDQHSAIPVQIARTGIRAIAVGSGDSNSLTLLHVSDTADIIKGDQLLTSGLGLRYPAGYPVGLVDSVSHVAGQGFAVVKATPSAHLRQSRQLLLVWPSRSSFLPQVQEQLQKSVLIPSQSVDDTEDGENNTE